MNKNTFVNTYIQLGILVILALIIVFFKFTSIPNHLAFDEVEFAKLALSLKGFQYTPYSTMATEHTTLYFYILGFFLNILGISTFSLRLASALFGILSIIVFFSVFKKTSLNKYALFAGFVLLSMRWFFSFARFGFEATFLLFLELTSIYFLLLSIKTKDIKGLVFIILAGIFAGFAFHSYYPGRIFSAVVVFYLWFIKKRKYIFPFLFFVLITALPVVLYFLKHPDMRISQLSIISGSIGIDKSAILFFENIKRYFLFLFTNGDMNGRHNFPGKPALNAVSGIVFVLGLFSLQAYTKYRTISFLFIIYGALSLLPALFTIPQDNPNMLRTYTMIPFIAVFIVFGYMNIYRCVKIFFSKKWALFFVIALFTASFLYDLRTYFVYQKRAYRNAFDITCPLSKSVSLSLDNLMKKCRVKEYLF